MLVPLGPPESLPGGQLARHDLEGPARLDVDLASVVVDLASQVAGTGLVCADLVPDRHLAVLQVRPDRGLDAHRGSLTDDLADRRVRFVDDQAHSGVGYEVVRPGRSGTR